MITKLFLLKFLFSLSFIANATISCTNSLERAAYLESLEKFEEVLDGETIQYSRIPLSELTRSHSSYFYSTRPIDDGKSIFLGVDDDGHFYMLVNGYRYDGYLYYQGAHVRRSRRASQGILFKVSDDSGEIKHQLERSIREHIERGMTCVSAGCRQLRNIDLDFDSDQDLMFASPQTFSRALLTNNLNDAHGRHLRVETFLLGDYDSLRLFTLDTKPLAYIAASIGAGALALLGGVVVYNE